MMISKPVLLLNVICLTVQSFSFAQSDKFNCDSIKDGNFYAYSNIYGSMVLKRAGAKQQEINATTADTTIWKVLWVSNCLYSLQYESGFKSDKALIALYKKHKRIINVTGVTDEYYLYKSYMDDVTDTDLPNDTMWLREQDFSNRQIATDNVNEASFSGGEEGWKAYITKVITKNSKALVKDGESGTCYISFIVNKDGRVTELEALTMENSKLASVAIEAIRKGPKWNPALKNDKPVNAYRIQPISFKIEEK